MNGEQYELPEGWRWEPLPEAAEIIMGQSPLGSTYNTNGNGFPFYQGKTDFGELHPTPRIWCSQPTKIAKPNDILMSVRAPVGPTNISNAECAIGRGLCIIRPRNGMPSRYLREYFQLIEDEIADMGKGSTFTSISRADLETIEVPVAPLPEQHYIVEKIEQLFAESRTAREALDRVPVLLKRFRQSVLAKAFRGELTEREPASRDEPASALLERIREERRRKWEEGKGVKSKKYVEPEPPNASGLPELPEGWCWATLPQLGELARGKSKHRPRDEKHLYGGPYPFIQTGDIARANGVITTYTQTYSEAGLAQSRLWPKGTMCITIAANIGDTAILGFDGCFPDSVVGFVANENACDLRYVEYFMRTAKDNLEQFAPATAQKNINLGTLQVLGVPLAPLAEQRRIVAKIESLVAQAEAIEQAVEIAQRRTKKVDQAMLARAFRGEL